MSGLARGPLSHFAGPGQDEIELTGVVGQWQRGVVASVMGASNDLEKPQDYPAMHDATRRLLEEFFEPYNQKLYRLIDEDFGWNQ